MEEDRQQDSGLTGTALTTEVSQLTPNIFRNYIPLKLEFSITTLSMSFLSILGVLRRTGVVIV